MIWGVSWSGLKTCTNGIVGQGMTAYFYLTSLRKKYKNAARELVWQCFLSPENLRMFTGERRRYHIHKTVLQKALRKAVQKARVPKRVTSHTFRHTYKGLSLFAICQSSFAGQL